jgi:dienelactone hydrolase
MPRLDDDRHSPRARPRIRRHLHRPRLPGWFSRLHRQNRRHLGLCIGGGFALLSAGAGYDAAAVNYGYPAASHAFLNDTETGPHLLRPLLRITGIGPEPDSAKDAWNRIQQFFATHLH